MAKAGNKAVHVGKSAEGSGRALSGRLFEALEARVLLSAARNPWASPFAANSVWNTPIGSSAVYSPKAWLDPHITGEDQTFLFQENQADPSRPVYAPGGSQYIGVGNQNFPDGWDALTRTSQVSNQGASFLRPDGHSLNEINDFYRPSATSAIYGFPTNNSNADLFGDGLTGGHGGSGVSVLGGLIRKGELTGSGPIGHALSLEMDGSLYYNNGNASSHVWPASQNDGNAGSTYGANNSSYTYEGPGALFAVPLKDGSGNPITAASLGVTTEPGKRILTAMQNYGGYATEDSGNASAGATQAYQFDFGTENGVAPDVQSAYGINIDDASSNGGSANMGFYNDVVAIMRAAKIVTNNGPSNVGGGGTPVTSATVAPFAYGVRKSVADGTTIFAYDYNTGGQGAGYNANSGDDPAASYYGGNAVSAVTDWQNLYRNDGVGIRKMASGNSDAEFSYQVGWTGAGQWLKYDVNLDASRTFNITFRVAAGGGGGTLHLEDDNGNNLTGSVSLPGTSSYDTYENVTVNNVMLPAGDHTLKLVEDSGGYDINSMSFKDTGVTTLAQGSFESPDASGQNGKYITRPTGSAWVYAASSGVASNGSVFGQTNTASGSQAAYLQGINDTAAVVSQSVFLTAGGYKASFSAVQRPGNNQTVQVLLDGNDEGSFTPGGSYQTFRVCVPKVGK